MSAPRNVSDDLLIRLLREGRHDSEVAVRLGISTGELRVRRAELRNRLGPERYDQLVLGPRKRTVAPRLKFFLWGASSAAGFFGLVLLAANIFAGGAEEEAPVRAFPASPTTPPLAPPPQVTIDGAVYEDLGPFVVSGSSDPGPVGTVSNRLALSVVDLRATSYIASSRYASWSLSSASRTDAFLRGTLAERQLDVSLYTERPRGRLRTIAEGVGPILEIDAERGFSQPVTILLSVTQAGSPLEARFTPEGRLLVALSPIALDRAVDSYNGGELGLAGATPFGRIATTIGSALRNACDPAPPGEFAVQVNCRVAWQRSSRGFVAPFAGVYSCSGARSVRYEGGGVRLEFILVGQSNASFACPPAEVTAGQSIVPDGEWIIAAESLETGRSLAIAVTLGGQVYVGEITSAAACPCLPRPT